MERYAYFGHHKCASKYIRNVLQALCAERKLKARVDWMTDNLPYGFHNTEENQIKWKRLRERIERFDFNFLQHINATHKVAEAANKHSFRGFHVIRDPRDVVVSAYFSHLYTHNLFSEWMSRQRQELKKIKSVEEGMLYDLETYTYVHLENMKGWKQYPHIYETKFEILTTDSQEWYRILDFLRIPYNPERFQQYLQLFSFEKMAGRNKGEEDQHNHYRKGIWGDWKNYFTPKITQKFKEKYGQLLVKLGYEFDTNW